MELTAKIHREDGMYWAEVEELPGCFASGASTHELLEALQEAVSMYLAPAPQSPPIATCVATVGLHVDDGARLPC